MQDSLIKISAESCKQRGDSGMPYLEGGSKPYIYGINELKKEVNWYFGNT